LGYVFLQDSGSEETHSPRGIDFTCWQSEVVN